jgi:hypothetical protein
MIGFFSKKDTVSSLILEFISVSAGFCSRLYRKYIINRPTEPIMTIMGIMNFVEN